MTADQVYNELPEEVWNSFFKFTIVRNPFDRVVSSYFWNKKIGRFDPNWSMRDYLQNEQKLPDVDVNGSWPIYTRNDEPVADEYVCYENMEDALNRISERIGFEESIWSIMKDMRSKASSRPKKSTYQDILSEDERRYISFRCEKEINYFDYKF